MNFKLIWNRVKANIVFQLASILVLYVFLDNLFFKVFYHGFNGLFKKVLGILNLENEVIPYFSWSIFLAALKSPFILLTIITFVFVSIKYKKQISWNNYELKTGVKFIIVFVCAILAWTYSAYDFNYYLNQTHYFDRFLLLILLICVYRSPIFLPFFIAVSLLILSQFNYPLNNYTLTDKKLLFNILILFQSYLVVNLFFKVKEINFIFLVLCLHASNYFIPGYVKMSISPNWVEWIYENEIYMHTYFSHLKGWLSFLSINQLSTIFHTVKLLNVPFLTISLLIELLAIVLLLFNKKWAIFCLLLFDLLHIGIFLESGIFFWKWILLNLALIYVIKCLGESTTKTLFSKKYLILSVIIIAFSKLYFKPIELGWWDTRLTELYTVEVESDKGVVYNINPNSMAPYDIMFSFSRFSFLDTVPKVLKNVHVTQNYPLFNSLKNDKPNIETTKSQYYNTEQEKVFKSFIKKTFVNLNTHKKKQVLISALGAPNHIYTMYFSKENTYNFDEQIKKVYIRYKEYYFNGKNLELLDNRIIKTIEIN